MQSSTIPVKLEDIDLTAVVTCYNHQAYVEQCLESVSGQTRQARQVIVIDDNSRDESPVLIERWLADHRPDWTYIRHSANRGVCATLNEALEIAEGTYFVQVSADDWEELDRFERQVAAFDAAEADVAVVVSDIREVEAGGGLLVEHDFGPRVAPLVEPGQRKRIVSNLLAENSIPAPGAMMRTSALRDVGGYDESLTFEDYDMWLRLGADHQVAYQPGVVANYRVVASGMTQNAARRALILRSEADALAKHIGTTENDDGVIARRLMTIAGAVLDLEAPSVFRDVLRRAQPVVKAPWIRGAIRVSRLPGGLQRVRRGRHVELGIPATRPPESASSKGRRR